MSITMNNLRRSLRLQQLQHVDDKTELKFEESSTKTSAKSSTKTSAKSSTKTSAKSSTKTSAKSSTKTSNVPSAKTSDVPSSKTSNVPSAKTSNGPSVKKSAKSSIQRQMPHTPSTYLQILPESPSEIVKQERRAKSLEIVPNKYQHTFEKQYRSLSFSPIYKRLSNLSLKKSFNGIRTPHDFLEYRLKTHEYLSRKDITTQLKIERLLAKIETNATGIVCLSKDIELFIDEKPHNIKVAIKIAENIMKDSLKEIFILEAMTKILRENEFHNLPIIYNSFQKQKSDFILKQLIDNNGTLYKDISGFLKSKNYNIYINELANGDLKSFLNEYDKMSSEITEELLNNAIIQIIMSIATLHDIGIRHNDTHHGNFLYHKIKPGGYIKYTIRNKSYYLKNLGYLWVIWDFGISTQLNGITDYFRDYEMLSLYLRKSDNTYNMRFYSKDINGEENRRAHGNLKLKNKEITLLINELTDTIYNFSINKDIGHVVDEKTMQEIISNKKKNLKTYTDISNTWYRVQVDGKNIDEATFLNEHINNIFTDVFEQNIININDQDVLFHVNINLNQIMFELKDGKSDYKRTTEKYNNQKIIIPVKYM